MKTKKTSNSQKYKTLIKHLFAERYVPCSAELSFCVDDLRFIDDKYNIETSNIPDLPYDFKCRSFLPPEILALLAPGKQWLIESTGKGKYRMHQVDAFCVAPDFSLPVTDIPDRRTPVVTIAQSKDEQGWLSRIFHNGVYDHYFCTKVEHVQSHLKTSIEGVGIEIDSLEGIDDPLTIIPVQAKNTAKRDRLNIVQTIHDIKYCRKVYAGWKLRPLIVEIIEPRVVIFELDPIPPIPTVVNEQHYRFV